MLSAFSSRTMRPEDWAKVRFFKPSDFHFPAMMGYEFMLWLDRVRIKAGVPITVTSDARSRAHNIEVGGAQSSAHTDTICNAADIGKRERPDDPNWNFSRWAIVEAAISLGCTRIGIYPGDGSLHLDRTEDIRPAPRIWIQVDNPAR